MQIDPERVRPLLDDRDGLRMTIVRDEKAATVPLTNRKMNVGMEFRITPNTAAKVRVMITATLKLKYSANKRMKKEIGRRYIVSVAYVILPITKYTAESKATK